MAGKRLINTVVDDFLREVVGSLCIGVHARALAHRVQTTEYLNRGSVVCTAHRRCRKSGGDGR